MYAYCKHNGIGIIPWALLASGALARPVGTETTRINSTKGTPFESRLIGGDVTIIHRVKELAQKKNCKMSRIALAWVGSKVASPTVGISSVQRLHETIVEGIELTPEEVAYLEEQCVLFGLSANLHEE